MANKDYTGLLPIPWTPTFVSGRNTPIAISSDLRGGLHSITGDQGDELTDIPGILLEDGMVVYVRNLKRYFQYTLLSGQSRVDGVLPNTAPNWSSFLGGREIIWLEVTGNVTIGNAHYGMSLWVKNNAVITIDDDEGLIEGWNINIIPDDSKDETSHTISIEFTDNSSELYGGLAGEVGGACSIGATPTANVYMVAGRLA